MQMSYTSLSTLNKSRPTNRTQTIILKPKIPFSLPSCKEEKKVGKIESVTNQEGEIDFKKRFLSQDLSRTLDGRITSEKIAANKALLAEKIKVFLYPVKNRTGITHK